MRKLKNQELNRISIEEFKNSKKTPISIILDDIRSLNNIGSVFRTADAFLIEKIYLCGITATPPNKDIHKTALGSTNSVNWEYHKNIIELLNSLKKRSNLIELYSVLYPETNSVSDSGRSNGRRLVSAKIEIRKIQKAIGCLKINQLNRLSL